jgi:hypothetical protein
MATQGSRLGSGLIVRKGEAAPAVAASAETPVPAVPPVAAPAPASVEPAMPKGVAGTVAITVRLDKARYERMKIHGAKERRTNQQILVAALDAYLAAHAPI